MYKERGTMMENTKSNGDPSRNFPGQTKPVQSHKQRFF